VAKTSVLERGKAKSESHSGVRSLCRRLAAISPEPEKGLNMTGCGQYRTNNKTIVATEEEKNSAKKNMKRRITFKFHAPEAKSVHLAGTFNEWNTHSHPLRQDKRSKTQGMWQRIFYLEPGVYEYRFIVDGRGHDDPRASEPWTNEFGSFNCVIWV